VGTPTSKSFRAGQWEHPSDLCPKQMPVAAPGTHNLNYSGVQIRAGTFLKARTISQSTSTRRTDTSSLLTHNPPRRCVTSTVRRPSRSRRTVRCQLLLLFHFPRRPSDRRHAPSDRRRRRHWRCTRPERRYAHGSTNGATYHRTETKCRHTWGDTFADTLRVQQSRSPSSRDSSRSRGPVASLSRT
jgi:hypothetical protein